MVLAGVVRADLLPRCYHVDRSSRRLAFSFLGRLDFRAHSRLMPADQRINLIRRESFSDRPSLVAAKPDEGSGSPVVLDCGFYQGPSLPREPEN